ncbi:MAG TPA: 16S rRNA (cytidine(1402)-2'-O)-methyltransferase [Peptococcaceae bacterium]|nr:16S rRNA (cytidine(1402)-2'-O)-methyltransferase [Peptococcaceae bacterium]
MSEEGLLYICATPIGNLADITLRVLDTLKNVDFIAAEDTRHSRKLLNHYGIKTPLLSYHQHNERQRTAEIVQRLKNGEKGALISDAGMPGISDPGQVLIRECLAENIPIDVLPGPNAAITALVLSGMPADSFLYLGFLPTGKKERREVLAQVAELPYTLIIYEAPHRLLSTLEDILEILGEREAAVARELTKIHQQVHKGLISELLAEFQGVPPKGECCLLLAPYNAEKKTGEPAAWLEELRRLEEAGVDRKEAMKTVAKLYGIRKRDIYEACLVMEEKKGR